MNITIKISKKDIEHLNNCDSEFDACGVIQDIIMKIKKKLKSKGETK